MIVPRFKVGDKVYMMRDFGEPTVCVVTEVLHYENDWHAPCYRIESIDGKYSLITHAADDIFSDVDVMVAYYTKKLKRFAKRQKGAK